MHNSLVSLEKTSTVDIWLTTIREPSVAIKSSEEVLSLWLNSPGDTTFSLRQSNETNSVWLEMSEPTIEFIQSTDQFELILGTVLRGEKGNDGDVINGINSISGANDIDLSNISDGATLVYQSSNSKWVATRTLDKQIIESGQF